MDPPVPYLVVFLSIVLLFFTVRGFCKFVRLLLFPEPKYSPPSTTPDSSIIDIPSRDENRLTGSIFRFIRFRKSLNNDGQEYPLTQAYFQFLDEDGRYFQSRGHGCFRVKLGVKPVVRIVSWATAKDVLLSSDLIDKPFQYELLFNWLGSSLLTSSGDVWKGKRRRLSKGFHNKNLRSFLPLLHRQAKRLTQEMMIELKVTPGRDGKSEESIVIRNFHKTCLSHALSIILETVMGVRSDNDDDKTSLGVSRGYSSALHDYTVSYIERVSSPWLWLDSFYSWTSSGRKARTSIETLTSFTQDIIVRQEKEEKEKNLRRTQEEEDDDDGKEKRKKETLLDLILACFPDSSEARNEVDTLVFAGHDTTGLAVFYVLFLLGHHPDIQERVQKEIDMMSLDGKEYNNYYQLPSLPFLEAVMKESLRLYPPVPAIGRKLSRTVRLPKPGRFGRDYYSILSGSNVVIDIYRIHRDPDFYDDPDSFKPDRFHHLDSSSSPSNDAQPLPFLAFSLGSRSCIGSKFALLEMKVLLTHILRRFRVTSLTPIEEVQLSTEIVLKPSTQTKDILMSFQERIIC